MVLILLVLVVGVGRWCLVIDDRPHFWRRAVASSIRRERTWAATATRPTGSRREYARRGSTIVGVRDAIRRSLRLLRPLLLRRWPRLLLMRGWLG